MENKEFKVDLDNFKRKYLKVPLPVNYFENQSKKNFTLHEVILEGQ